MQSTGDVEWWDIVAQGALPEFVVEWEGITERMLDELRRLLAERRGERPLQAFLQCYPTVLVQILRGGHRRWVIPQKRLSDKHVVDFILGEFNSLGHHWYPVELESPTAKPFIKSGDFSRPLTHAIRQIEDWRGWLDRNLEHARRDRVDGGLGLRQIRSDSKALIFIGRRDMLTPETQRRREQMSYDSGIDIHTYDHLYDAATSWLNTLKGALRAVRHPRSRQKSSAKMKAP